MNEYDTDENIDESINGDKDDDIDESFHDSDDCFHDIDDCFHGNINNNRLRMNLSLCIVFPFLIASERVSCHGWSWILVLF